MKLIKMLTPPVKASVILTSAVAFGDTEVVSVANHQASLYVPGDKTGALQSVAVETYKQSTTEYPAGVEPPIFWFDASDREDWTVDVDGNVQKIPNKVGDGRYLTATETGDQWKTSTGCGAVQFGQHNVPKLLESDPTLGGRPSVDFGPLASKRLLFFNPIGPEGNTTNLLEGIGSIVAVWNSENGGGYLLGDNLNGGYKWCRGPDPTLPHGSGIRTLTYMAPMAQYNSYASLNGAFFRLNGVLQQCNYAGFNGSWAVVSLLPKAADLTASGLGMNDTRVTAFSGGFRVAEMLIFDRVLTTAECKLLETWLKGKWLGRADRGVNGNAYLSLLRPHQTAMIQWGFATTVNVPADEKLTLGRLEGGYGDVGASPDANDGGASIVKSGAGTLELGEMKTFSAPVKVGGGTVAVSRKPIPETLPYGLYLDFDASADGALETSVGDDGEYLDYWNEQLKPTVAALTFDGAQTMATGADRPRVMRNALGTGLHMIDLGKRQASSLTHYLQFRTIDPTADVPQRTSHTVPGVTTYIAVVGVQNGGGDILGYSSGWYATRGLANPTWKDQLCGQTGTINGEPITDHASYMIDGVFQSSAEGYPTPGYHVIAVRCPAGAFTDRIGGYYTYAGGLRVGRILAYLRNLTDEEMADASAYLMNIWLKRDAPGYARAEPRTEADVQNLALSGDTTVDVSADKVVVDALSGINGTLVKEGAGTLAVRNLDLKGVGLVVKDGAIVPEAASDVASDCEPAAGASFHLDATRTDTFDFDTDGSEERILYWRDTDNRDNVAFAQSFARAPSLVTATDGLKSELPVVDFGAFTLNMGTGRDLHFARPIESLKSVFVICATQEGDSRGIFLGSSKRYPGGSDNRHYGYLRPSTSETADILLHDNNSYAQIYEGTFLTNGIAINPRNVAPPTGEFFLLESHPQGAAHLSALGESETHAKDRNGGVRIAELIVYERALSEREKIATRNYLMMKWLGRKSGAKMPDPPDQQKIVLPELAVQGDVDMPVEGDVSVLNLSGAGSLSKSGDGTLELQDLSVFDGSVSVAEGTVRLAGMTPASTGRLVTDGLVFQADASWGVTTVTNEYGDVSVTRWDSRTGGGWSAVPFKQTVLPRYVGANDLGGHRVVDMPRGDANGMVFAKDGVATNLFDGIVSVYWMIGSHEGGGYLLGGGTNYEGSSSYFNFMRHRDDTSRQYFEYTDNMLNGVEYWTVPSNVRKADWYLDGEAIDPTTTPLSGGWDLISFQINDAGHPFTCAEGFAFDGRYIRGEGMGNGWCGGQKLAEVLFYDRQLSDEERVDVENYLRAKWGFNGTQASPSNAVTVAVAKGATLDLGGNVQYLADVTGEGTITNGKLTLGTLVADPLAESVRMLDCTVAFREAQVIEVRNAAAITDNQLVKILDCTAVENLPRRKALVFTGDTSWCENYRAKLVFADGALYLQFVPNGMMLLIR